MKSKALIIGGWLIATTVSLMAPAQAKAPQITWISPQSGASLTGSFEAVLSATTPYVRVGLDQNLQFLPPVPVGPDGTVTVPLDARGLWPGGGQLLAQPCQTQDPASCDRGSYPRSFVAAAPPATIVSPTEGSVLTPASGTLHVTVSGSSNGFSTLRLVSSETKVPVVDGAADLDSSAVPDGGELLLLSTDNPFFDVSSIDDVVRLESRVRILNPEWPSDGVVSPNGDGYLDTATMTLGLDASVPQVISWTLRQDGAVVRGPVQPFGGDAQALRATFDVDPAGLPDGRYTLVLRGEASPNGIAMEYVSRGHLRIDTVGVSIERIRPDRRRFAPTRQPRLVIRVDASPEGQVRRMQVLDAEGHLVRGLRRGLTTPFTTWWNGRTRDGTIAPPGVYRFRVVLVDSLENRTERIGGRVTVVR